jgi:FG-GAP-like repeat
MKRHLLRAAAVLVVSLVVAECAEPTRPLTDHRPRSELGSPVVSHTLGDTVPDTGLVARDVIAGTGLEHTSYTYGKQPVFDFDGDSRLDILLSNHCTSTCPEPWQLMRNDGGGHRTEVMAGAFAPRDRHGCTVGDFGGRTASGGLTGPDGRPDIYCTQGAGGNDITREFPNELWLLRPDGTYGTINAAVAAAKAWGLADVHGRGRDAVALDFDRDGKRDLFWVDAPGDSVSPQHNYLARNLGGTAGGFAIRTGGVITVPSGNLRGCAAAGDVSGDGYPDLVVCESAGLRLYLNGHGYFYNATGQRGPAGVSEPRDVRLADLNADGRPDLVVVEWARLTVWLNRSGSFPQRDFALTLSAGQAAAVADADGDGRPDIYVCQGPSSSAGPTDPQVPDSILLNDGTGVHYRSLAVPNAAGVGDNVTALPNWNGAGQSAFLVSNGFQQYSGPRQLIVVERQQPATPQHPLFARVSGRRTIAAGAIRSRLWALTPR